MSSLPYTLIRSKRRSLSLQINKHGELIARAPMRMSVDFIEDFINRKKDWIIKHQTRIQNSESRIQRKEYSDKQIVEMKKELLEYIVPKVAEIWKSQNLPKYTNIKITKSEWRWWSCSARNGLCFSYRLAEYLNPLEKGGGTRKASDGGLAVSEKSENQSSASQAQQLLSQGAPEDFIDAIIVHELAHLREKNHQKPFWNLVYSIMPEYEKVMKVTKGEMRNF